MAGRPEYPEPGTRSDGEPNDGLRRWIKIIGLVVLVVVLVVIALMLTGGGGHTPPPGAH